MNMKDLRGQCQHCGGRFDFPAEMIGTSRSCPHCGKETEMLLERPRAESEVPKRMVVYCVLAIAILGLGLVATTYALQRARSIAQRKNPAAAQAGNSVAQTSPGGPFVVQTNDFYITAAAVRKPTGEPLSLAFGVLSNGLNRPRLGVSLTFDVLDRQGQKIGTTMDSIILVEPLGKWQFRAPLLQTNAAAVRFVHVHEEKSN
jgi:hypothetical protein